MDVSRMGYIVYYRNRQVLKKLETMPVNLAYVSNKFRYAVFYGELKQEKNYFNNLKNVRGFVRFEQQPAFDETLNFNVK